MVFEKLYKFIGKDIKSMIERPDGRYCLRLHKNRVYYVSEGLMKKATNVSSSMNSSRRTAAVLHVCCFGCSALASQQQTQQALQGRGQLRPTDSHAQSCNHHALQVARDKLVSLGTPVGKLTHSGKFRLTVGALDVLARYAKHKVSQLLWLKCRQRFQEPESGGAGMCAAVAAVLVQFSCGQGGFVAVVWSCMQCTLVWTPARVGGCSCGCGCAGVRGRHKPAPDP